MREVSCPKDRAAEIFLPGKVRQRVLGGTVKRVTRSDSTRYGLASGISAASEEGAVWYMALKKQAKNPTSRSKHGSSVKTLNGEVLKLKILQKCSAPNLFV